MITYTFPSDYPRNCPPLPHNEMCGTYYRVAVNKNKLDRTNRTNYASHYDRNLRPNLESTRACNRCAVSIFAIYALINI